MKHTTDLHLAAWRACQRLRPRADSSEPAVQTLSATTVYGRGQADPAPNGPVNLDARDSTGSRLGLTLRETPASVTVISREQIEARGSLSTQEIARGIPGVDNASPPATPARSATGVSRAARSCSCSTVSRCNTTAIAGRPVDSWIYDRVEAIGGPSIFLFGAGAVGGAINYVTSCPSAIRSTTASCAWVPSTAASCRWA